MDIGELLVTRISGPTSFKYLFPLEEEFIEKAKKGVFLPIIILLGDIHFSEDGRCDPCDEKDGCFLVESDAFLSTLNSLSNLKCPIDIYTEHSPTKKVSINGGVLFNKFVGRNSECYGRTLGKARCKFPNIRWHYTDPRYWEGKMEFDAAIVSNYLAAVGNHDMEKDFFKPSVRSDLFKRFLMTIFMLGKKDEDMKDLSKSLSDLMKKYIKDIEYQDSPFGKKKKLQSVVHKEIRRAELDMSIDFYCYFSLEFHGMVSEKKIKDEINIERVEILYNYIYKDSPFPSLYKEILNQVRDMWVTFTACLLDIYFLARIQKPVTNSSYVTIGFFGDNHVKALTSDIKNRLYELKHDSDKEKERCIILNDRVNFNKDLKRYTQWRIKYSL